MRTIANSPRAVGCMMLLITIIAAGCTPAPAPITPTLNGSPAPLASSPTPTLSPAPPTSPPTRTPARALGPALRSPTPTATSGPGATATFTPFIQPIPTRTSGHTPTTILLAPGQPGLACPHFAEQGRISFSASPYCISWVDLYDDETGFRIVWEYDNSGEIFVYEVGPGVTELFPPEEHTPRLGESREQCMRRKDFTLTVIALRPLGDRRIDQVAWIVECFLPELPTATPSLDTLPATPMPTSKPLELRGGGLAYDRERGEVLYFGGVWTGNCDPCNHTWAWDGTRWNRYNPPVVPTPRLQPGLAYNAARGRVVLFGGWDGQRALNDTWLWDGENWVEAHPPVSPSPRLDARLVYDAARQVILLFGGSRREGEDVLFLDETWTWDGQTWAEHPSGELSNGAIPQPSLAYDAAREQVVLWQYATGTWTWDGRAWTHQEPTDSPDLFVEGVLGYDEARQQAVLWHAAQDATDSAETWAWDGNTWSLVDTGELPGPKFSAESYLVYDPRRQALLLFAVTSEKTSAGCPADCFEMSIWAWTGAGWSLDLP